MVEVFVAVSEIFVLRWLKEKVVGVSRDCCRCEGREVQAQRISGPSQPVVRPLEWARAHSGSRNTGQPAGACNHDRNHHHRNHAARNARERACKTDVIPGVHLIICEEWIIKNGVVRNIWTGQDACVYLWCWKYLILIVILR